MANKQNYLKNELGIRSAGGCGMKQPLGQAEGLGNSFLRTERLEDKTFGDVCLL